MSIHEKYMARCIELAKNGLGTTYPNPMVGCVIVSQNKIIGEGWHYQAGQPHAEVNAIQSVKDKSVLKYATIYVSLEPCSHFGKTPPCSHLIIKHEIPNIVIGTQDPFAKVDGAGITQLKKAGKEVIVGILEKECQQLNSRFFTFHRKKRPYIILKWAQSLDGYMSPETKTEQIPIWISSSESRQLVHKWRSEEQSILVGTKTVLEDNPKLNTRDWYGNNPVRVVIDQHLIINENYHVKDNHIKTIIITEIVKKTITENIIYETIDFYSSIPKQIGAILYKHELQSVIIEGGSKTIQQFIDSNLWDEARVTTGTDIIIKKGTLAPKLNKDITTNKAIGSDLIKTYYNHTND